MTGRFALIATLLLIASPVTAQEFSVTVNNPPSDSSLTAGDGASYALNVTLSGDGFECSEDVPKPVNATLNTSIQSPAPPNASISGSNATAEYTIPQGIHDSSNPAPNTEPYNESQTLTVSVSTDGGVKQNYTATASLRVVFPGGPTGSPTPACNPPELPSAETTKEFSIEVKRDVKPQPKTPDDGGDASPPTTTPPSDNGTTQDNGTTASPNTSDDGSDANGIPVPWAAAPLAFAAAALYLRRR